MDDVPSATIRAYTGGATAWSQLAQIHRKTHLRGGRRSARPHSLLRSVVPHPCRARGAPPPLETVTGSFSPHVDLSVGGCYANLPAL
jgi:hypothetical protein